MAADTTLLWPVGQNRELLYGMGHYFQSILSNHGTKLMGEEIMKVQKLLTGLKSLLTSINGDDVLLDINFTLPGIYYLWDTPSSHHNNTENTSSTPSSFASTVVPSSTSISSNISMDLSSSPSDVPVLERRSRQNRSLSTPSRKTSNATNMNDDDDDDEKEKQNKENKRYGMFNPFLIKLRQQNTKINELSPQYLYFLEEARKQYNLQFAQKK
eukprot:176675_1